MSFRGAKRRGNPLNRNANTVAIATDRSCSRNLYRATTLLSQNKRDKNSNHNSERVLAWWAHCVCRDKSVQAGIKKSCRSFAKLSAWLAHFVRSFLCLRKARFLPCLPFIYRFFSLPNRAPLLKRHRGYGNHLKCHSEEQSAVGIP